MEIFFMSQFYIRSVHSVNLCMCDCILRLPNLEDTSQQSADV